MSKVLERQPLHTDALVYRGLTRMRLSAFTGAAQDFQTILSIAPEVLPIQRDLASASLRQGKIDDAISLYKRIVDQNPEDLVARWDLKVAHAQQGRDANELPARYHIAFNTDRRATSPVTFADVAPQLGAAALSRGRGSAWGDYDSDGDLDLCAAIGGAMFGDRQPNSMYRNSGSSHHWLKLRLRATKSNPDAIDARVKVTTQQGSRYHTVAGGRGFRWMNDPVVLIGLGTAARVERVEVRWSSGMQQRVENLAANQVIVMTE